MKFFQNFSPIICFILHKIHIFNPSVNYYIRNYDWNSIGSSRVIWAKIYDIRFSMHQSIEQSTVGWMDGFSVGLEPRSELLQPGQAGPETCHHNFDLPRRGWFPRFGTPRGIIWKGIWRTLQIRRVLHASSAISIHGGVLPGKLRNRTFQSGDECSDNKATAAWVTLNIGKQEFRASRLNSAVCIKSFTFTFFGFVMNLLPTASLVFQNF